MTSVGRNEPCPCGSGRRYKSCHGSVAVAVRRVDFVVAGTQKGGTTALTTYLREHPEICMPGTRVHPRMKELHHFDNETVFASRVVDHAIYHSCFEPLARHRVLGEATPVYMYWDSAPRRIKTYNPAMKIIMLLRNPVMRAYSHWNMEVAKGRETMSFDDALRSEPERCRDALPLQTRRQSYADRGRYSTQIKRIWALFPRSQTLLLRSEAFQSDPAPALAQITEFLGVSPYSDVEPRTVYATPYERPMTADAHAWLREAFADEIAELEDMLGWDLSDWRT
jgi:hypothetical protein